MRRKIAKGMLRATGVGALLFSIFVLVLTIAEYQPRNEEPIEIHAGREAVRTIYEGEQIELLTWNIGYGGLDAEMDSRQMGGKGEKQSTREQVEANLSGMTDMIRAQNCDVVFLQEVDRRSMRSFGMNEVEWFERELGMTSAFALDYICLFVPYPIFDCTGSINSGLQTLTRLPVESARRTALNSEHIWPARVWEDKPCLLVSRVAIEGSGRELVLINLRMNAYENSRHRERQMATLTELMEEEWRKGNYVIAGGDFHQVFPDDNFVSYPILRSEYFKPSKMVSQFGGAGWTFASDRSAPSCRLLDEPYQRKKWWAQLYVMDGYILSPNIELIEIKTMQEYFEYSDHNPVKLTVRLKPTEARMTETEEEQQ